MKVTRVYFTVDGNAVAWDYPGMADGFSVWYFPGSNASLTDTALMARAKELTTVQNNSISLETLIAGSGMEATRPQIFCLKITPIMGGGDKDESQSSGWVELVLNGKKEDSKDEGGAKPPTPAPTPFVQLPPPLIHPATATPTHTNQKKWLWLGKLKDWLGSLKFPSYLKSVAKWTALGAALISLIAGLIFLWNWYSKNQRQAGASTKDVVAVDQSATASGSASTEAKKKTSWLGSLLGNNNKPSAVATSTNELVQQQTRDQLAQTGSLFSFNNVSGSTINNKVIVNNAGYVRISLDDPEPPPGFKISVEKAPVPMTVPQADVLPKATAPKEKIIQWEERTLSVFDGKKIDPCKGVVEWEIPPYSVWTFSIPPGYDIAIEDEDDIPAQLSVWFGGHPLNQLKVKGGQVVRQRTPELKVKNTGLSPVALKILYRRTPPQ